MMRYLLYPLLAVSLLASGGHAQSLSITGPSRDAMLENHTYTITWESEGLKSVSLLAYGERTRLGRRSRGIFRAVIAEGVPADRGQAAWKVPWLDGINLKVKAKGYSDQGSVVAVTERPYAFRPAVLADRRADGIYLDLSKPRRQRLYVQRDGRLTRAYITTSSMNYLFRPPGSHPKAPHDHAGVFKILGKERSHWSNLYHVQMRWAMRYHGGHFIHATSPNLYDELGEIASHGCNRLTRYDAQQLYSMTPVGMRVEVIGRMKDEGT